MHPCAYMMRYEVPRNPAPELLAVQKCLQLSLTALEQQLVPRWLWKNRRQIRQVTFVKSPRLPPCSQYISFDGADHNSNIDYLLSQAKPVPDYSGFYYAENKTGILIFAKI